jgi:hypothetical protein
MRAHAEYDQHTTADGARVSARTAARIAGAAGLAGSLLLVAYFTGGLREPPADASASRLLLFAQQHRHGLMVAGWLQAVGTTLGAIFFLGLAEAASRGRERLLTQMLGLGVAALVALSLLESILIQDIAEAARNGHLTAVVTSFDQETVFGHAFLTVAAPLVYATIALILRRSNLLPAMWMWGAAGLAVVFELLGIVGLFSQTAQNVAVVPLIAQAAWIFAVSITLLGGRRRTGARAPAPSADVPVHG